MIWTRPLLTPLRVQVLLTVLILGQAAYILATGVDWIREDWESLYFAAQGSWQTAWPDSYLVRPPKVLLYELTYRTFGNHPVIAVVYLNLCLLVSALLVFRLLRLYLPLAINTAILLFWIFVPTHISLLRWPSVVHANTALVLAAAALLCVVHKKRLWYVVFSALAILTYEAVAVVLVVAPLWIQRDSFRCRTPRALLLLGATALVPVLTFIYVTLTAAQTRTMAPFDYRFLAQSTFAFGIDERWVWIFVALPVALLTVFFLARLLQTSHKRTIYDRCIVAGTLVAILGALPFALNGVESVFTGLGDRATLVSGFGSSALWVGLIGNLTYILRHDPSRTLIPSVLMVGILLLPRTVQIHADYQHLNRTTKLEVNRALTFPMSPIEPSQDPRIKQLLVVPDAELFLRAHATCATRQMKCPPEVFEKIKAAPHSHSDLRDY